MAVKYSSVLTGRDGLDRKHPEFAQWIKMVDDTLLTASPRQPKRTQSGQKQRETFLALPLELVADEQHRNRQILLLVGLGLLKDAELTIGECSRATSSTADGPSANDSPDRRRKRKPMVLSADFLCHMQPSHEQVFQGNYQVRSTNIKIDVY